MSGPTPRPLALRGAATGGTSGGCGARPRVLPGVPGLRGGHGHTFVHLAHIGDERAGRRGTGPDARQGPCAGPLHALLLPRDLVAAVDPDLAADHAEGGLGLG